MVEKTVRIYIHAVLQNTITLRFLDHEPPKYAKLEGAGDWLLVKDDKTGDDVVHICAERFGRDKIRHKPGCIISIIDGKSRQVLRREVACKGDQFDLVMQEEHQRRLAS